MFRPRTFIQYILNIDRESCRKSFWNLIEDVHAVHLPNINELSQLCVHALEEYQASMAKCLRKLCVAIIRNRSDSTSEYRAAICSRIFLVAKLLKSVPWWPRHSQSSGAVLQKRALVTVELLSKKEKKS